jgi:hypothetical protein
MEDAKTGDSFRHWLARMGSPHLQVAISGGHFQIQMAVKRKFTIRQICQSAGIFKEASVVCC